MSAAYGSATLRFTIFNALWHTHVSLAFEARWQRLNSLVQEQQHIIEKAQVIATM